jgi:hypothetical protein
MPSVDSLEALDRAIAAFEVGNLALVIEPSALAVARRSLDESGLLLLGEVHGVRENPLVIRALLQAFGLTALALEWPDALGSVIATYLAGEELADHPALWLGDGRITAGHLAVLRERAAAGQLELVLFDGVMSAGFTWSQRDEAMADRVLARAKPVGTEAVNAEAGHTGGGLLVVAGNAHTPTQPTSLGVPLGACLARQRPGVEEIRIRYGSGHFYNLRPRRFHPQPGMLSRHRGQIRLHAYRGSLILDLPEPTEAIIPHRPAPA